MANFRELPSVLRRYPYSNKHKRIGATRDRRRFDGFEIRKLYHDTRRYFEKVDMAPKVQE